MDDQFVGLAWYAWLGMPGIVCTFEDFVFMICNGCLILLVIIFYYQNGDLNSFNLGEQGNMLLIGRENDLAVEAISQNPDSSSRLGSSRSSLISNEHAELRNSSLTLVLCCAWSVTSHCTCTAAWANSARYQLEDDEWVAATHCRRVKRSRITDTPRLWWSLQFRYINNQSLLTSLYFTNDMGSFRCVIL